MSLSFKSGITPVISTIIEVYAQSGINRPISDKDRIEKMYANSNLIVTAWDNDKLIGIARSLTDFCYSCYLSDLAVRKDYQGLGVGKKLIEVIRERIGEQTTLILISAPSAIDFYPKIGFEKTESAFIIKRKN